MVTDVTSIKLISLISYISAIVGELAQMARALVWQTRGHRFDSGILHKNNGGACTEAKRRTFAMFLM
jgi:hypothetical protein